MDTKASVAKLEHRVDGPDGAPVLVLGNSLGTNLEMWDVNMDALAARFRVVRFNHRGHGGSDVPDGPYTMDELGGDVAALLDELGIDRFSYAGVSLGGMVGMWLAAHLPERVERLVVGPSAARLEPADIWNDRARAVRGDGTASVADAIVARWFTDGYKEAHPEVVAAIRDQVAGNHDEGHAGCVEAIRDMDLRPDLPKIAAPTLVIAGSDDPATPSQHTDLIAATIPGATLVSIKPGAHLSSIEQAPLFSALIVAHVGGSV